MSRDFAAKHWPGRSPVGARFRVGEQRLAHGRRRRRRSAANGRRPSKDGKPRSTTRTTRCRASCTRAGTRSAVKVYRTFIVRTGEPADARTPARRRSSTRPTRGDPREHDAGRASVRRLDRAAAHRVSDDGDFRRRRPAPRRRRTLRRARAPRLAAPPRDRRAPGDWRQSARHRAARPPQRREAGRHRPRHRRRRRRGAHRRDADAPLRSRAVGSARRHRRDRAARHHRARRDARSPRAARCASIPFNCFASRRSDTA